MMTFGVAGGGAFYHSRRHIVGMMEYQVLLFCQRSWVDEGRCAFRILEAFRVGHIARYTSFLFLIRIQNACVIPKT